MTDTSGAHRVLLSTANPHKVTEIQYVLGASWHVVPFASSAPETGSSFEENALQKAVALRDATGELTVADDSGIEIDALGGRPGVYSSRWTNEEDWIPRALRELDGIPMVARTCRYVCAAAVAYPDGTESVVRASVEGYVAEQPRGTGGFGYDPIMIPVEGDGRTFAEMEDTVKNGISHRGRAFQMLEQLLRFNVGQAVEEEDPEHAEAPLVEGYERVPDAYHDLVAGHGEVHALAGEYAADGSEFAVQATTAHGEHAGDGEHDAHDSGGAQPDEYAGTGDDEQAETDEHAAAAADGDAAVPEHEGAAAAADGADQTGGGGPVGVGGGYPEGPGTPAPASVAPGGDQPGGGPGGGAGGDHPGGPGGAPHEPESGQPVAPS